MNATMLGLLAESPIHPGSGRSMGVVDLPVAREAATNYPVLVGSSLKGALRDKANAKDADHYFGKPDQAGELRVSDGRLLLLPVRSLTGTYRWATCRHLIERFRRDLARANLARADLEPPPELPSIDQEHVLATGDGTLFLEERQFHIAEKPPQAIVDTIKPLLLHQETQDRLDAQLAILNDEDFAWFARYGLAIQARNVLEDGTKKSKNLWYEETLPPDTVMYTLISGRGGKAHETLGVLFPEDDPYLQVGGNETVGQGWFAVRPYGAGNGGVS